MQTIPDWDHDALTSMITAQGENVVERLDHWARTTPDKTFFYYGERDETFSYAHFGALTDAIAGSLHNYGIVRGDRVSVLSTNSLLCALVMFASWKVGAVYAPINFSFTGRMLTYQINDTRARLLITDAALLGAVNDVAGDLDHLPEVVLFEPSAGDGEVASTRIDPVFATVPSSISSSTTRRASSTPRGLPVRPRASSNRIAGSRVTPTSRACCCPRTT